MGKGVLSKLAGETAVYGMSTILARIINFFFVPLYTRVLSRGEFGILSEFMSYIAVLQVLLVLGLETGCFRFASRTEDSRSVFSTAMGTVAVFSLVLMSVFFIFPDGIAEALGYPSYGFAIMSMAAILVIDSVTSILFAKMRHEGKAWKFATVKTVKILSETLGNIVLFFCMPSYLSAHPDSFLNSFIPAQPDFSYPLTAILLSCVVVLVLLIPDFLRVGFRIRPSLCRMMLVYSVPVMLAGLPGIINDFMDRLLFRFLIPDDVSWQAELGVYQAGVKLSVIMSLFIQMFRYAAEPFFFSRSDDSGSKKLYALVMQHFVAFCMLIFLAVTVYSDLIGLLLGKDFREGVCILPVMLMSYVFLGMTFNVSMWYKLIDRTGFAIVITLAGMAVTAVVNIIFMPLYSYIASAWGHLVSYLAMLVVSVVLGRRYNPFPYRWGRIILYIVSALLLYGVSCLVRTADMPWMAETALNTLLVAAYAVMYIKLEKINFRTIIPVKRK